MMRTYLRKITTACCEITSASQGLHARMRGLWVVEGLGVIMALRVANHEG